MKDFRSHYQDRECREFWTVHNFEAMQVQGFFCGPENDYWWCPEIGLSISIEHHTYATEQDAINAAIEEIDTEIKALEWHRKSAIKRIKPPAAKQSY